MAQFDGKVVFITGASSGIGEALAREFAGRGAAVALGARREDRLQALCEQIRAKGGKALAVRCDVTVDGEVEIAVARIREDLGPVDVVVANAGFGVVGRIERLGLEDYRRQFETNVFGVLRTVMACLPDVKARKGSIVLMGSVAAFVPGPMSSPYAMSKACIRSLGDSLWAELAHDGVCVTSIHPGFVDSEIRKVDNRGTFKPEAKETVPRWLLMPTPRAARQMVDAVACRRREAVVTLHGKIAVFLSRATPGLLSLAVRHSGRKGRRRGVAKKEG